MKKFIVLALVFASGILAAAVNLEVPCIKGSETYKRIVLPAVKFNKGDRVLLNFEMFMKRTVARGWAPIVALQVNGKTVRAKDSKGNPRMAGANAAGFKVKDKAKETLRSWWYQNSRLYVFYGPQAGKVDSRIVADENTGKYSLDVTDLMVSGKPVSFRAVNYLYREAAGGDVTLTLQNIEFKVVPAKK